MLSNLDTDVRPAAWQYAVRLCNWSVAFKSKCDVFSGDSNIYKIILPFLLFHHFVLICFNFLSLQRKLLAYAFGTIFLSFGSCTKYSYPCLSAKRIASSLLLKLICVPCTKSADDCQPIRGFSHRCPFDIMSQSMRQWWPCHSPDCVAGLAGL